LFRKMIASLLAMCLLMGGIPATAFSDGIDSQPEIQTPGNPDVSPEH